MGSDHWESDRTVIAPAVGRVANEGSSQRPNGVGCLRCRAGQGAIEASTITQRPSTRPSAVDRRLSHKVVLQRIPERCHSVDPDVGVAAEIAKEDRCRYPPGVVARGSQIHRTEDAAGQQLKQYNAAEQAAEEQLGRHAIER